MQSWRLKTWSFCITLFFIYRLSNFNSIGKWIKCTVTFFAFWRWKRTCFDVWIAIWKTIYDRHLILFLFLLLCKKVFRLHFFPFHAYFNKKVDFSFSNQFISRENDRLKCKPKKTIFIFLPYLHIAFDYDRLSAHKKHFRKMNSISMHLTSNGNWKRE